MTAVSEHPATSGASSRGATGEDLRPVVRQLLTPAWQVTQNQLWHTATPTGYELPAQGWKIHVSATTVSVRDVLAGAVPVLVEHSAPFKFPTDLAAVRLLTGRDSDRAVAGKILTVYPRDDDEFRSLVKALHDAVGQLPGPRILSDRPYTAGSTVHYRYGGFRGDGALDADGVYRYLLSTPAGGHVEDTRAAWFEAPSWAPCPLDDSAKPDTPRANSVLLGGHYVVSAALRHSAKGGVYLATDDRDGTEVVVKHARAHAEHDASGHDARDLLRNESSALDALTGIAPVPAVRELFEQDGDLFLVEEKLTGRPLHSWVRDHAAAHPGVPVEDAWPVARALTAAVTAVHSAGLALRDLSPSNVLVTDDNTVRLVDLELAGALGSITRRSGTPAYQAPEHRFGEERAVVTAQEDLFSLGALLFLLATGADPLLPDDDIERSAAARLLPWLDLVAADGETAAALRPVIAGLLSDAPAERPGLAEVTRCLMAGTRPDGELAETAPLPRLDRLAADGLAYLVESVDVTGPRLWPTGSFGSQTDPGNVQHGAAGVLSTLTMALPHVPAADFTTRTTKIAAEWLAAQRPARPETSPLPGLYFGRSGVAWALAEAGIALGDDALLTSAADELLKLPLAWPNPDVAHGLAGACLAHLKVASLTGDGTLRERAHDYADEIAARAEHDDQGVHWTIPRDFDSVLAGKRHHGFAHGTAGIGYALLVNGRGADVELATRAGHALCDIAHVDEHGAAWWPVGRAEPLRLPHWCSGSSGIGTFLLRLFAHTGEQRFADTAAAAARAVHRARWQASTAACHGLAGDGQFLLDAAEILLDPTYHGWARDLATFLAARHCARNGRLLVADESSRTVVADLQVGVAGAVAFLVRLLHGGARPFMLDGVTT